MMKPPVMTELIIVFHDDSMMDHVIDVSMLRRMRTLESDKHDD